MTTPQLTSRLRGGGCGVLVGALAVAAHGMAGGGVPRSAELTLLLLVSLAAGMLARGGVSTRPASSRHRVGALVSAPGARAASALLAGQWAGHFALAGALDHHGGVLDVLHLPGVPMITAHLVAAFACAALILVAERLYLVASSVVRAVLTAPSTVVVARGTRWLAGIATARDTRVYSARCPRAPPLSV